MGRLIDEIAAFLESNGFDCSRQVRSGLDVICTKTPDGSRTGIILPLEITARTPEEAIRTSEAAACTVTMIHQTEGYPLIVPEDRWRRQRRMMEVRLLAHLEVFGQAYARNCEVRRIEKADAQAFLAANHSYGDAACRYRYGLFLKRHTGHVAKEMRSFADAQDDRRGKQDHVDKLIAVATFSNARKWIKEGKEIRSYEWTRYASLPDLRISGGMGKILKVFIKDVRPDDIMSYADLEWSEGAVYGSLGFVREGGKDPVMFMVDPQTWERVPLRPGATGSDVIAGSTGNLFYRNFGSSKYRLKLTEYK